jgi:predicted secreted protein
MSAERSIGTKLQKTSGTPAYIADLISIGEVGLENSEIDVTTLDSPSNYKEYIAGFKDAGEVALKGFVKSEANMEDMLDLAEAQTVATWEITFQSGAKWFFAGFVKTWKEAESTVEGVRGFTGSIRISGKPVYASTGISA